VATPLGLTSQSTLTFFLFHLFGLLRSFGTRAKARKDRWLLAYEVQRQKIEDTEQTSAQLEREIEFLEELGRKQNFISDMFDLAWSVAGLVVFWVVGASIFYSIEVCVWGLYLGRLVSCVAQGWPFGTAFVSGHCSRNFTAGTHVAKGGRARSSISVTSAFLPSDTATYLLRHQLEKSYS
jgi:hypothetical protein